MAPRTKNHGKKKVLQGSGSNNPRNQAQEEVEVDPYYTPELQGARFAKFLKRKFISIRYADMVWFVSKGFQFPLLLETQGVVNFLELEGIIYPNLVKEFYANFQYKDGACVSMIKGKYFCMNKDIFLQVGGLTCDGARIGDCDDEAWDDFDANETYISCLRSPDLYVQGTLKKAGLFSVENRILHYLIVYILAQRSTNLAQPTIRDLQLMYAIKNGILLDWPAEILRVMYQIAESDKSLPLAYSIFISRIVDYLGIDTSSEIIEHVTKKDHLIDEGMIHKMSIYFIHGEWIYQSEYMVDIEMQEDSGNAEDEEPNEDNQHAQDQNEADSNIPGFGIAHLDAMEQRMYARMQGMEDRIFARMDGMESNFQNALRMHTEALQAEFSRMNFVQSTLHGFTQPPPPPQP